MKYSQIIKKIQNVGFDCYYQAGSINVFSKMNIVAESKVLNMQFWICINGGYRCKDTYYIASKPLNDTNAKSTRDYCKNQSDMIQMLNDIKNQIRIKKKKGGAKIYVVCMDPAWVRDAQMYDSIHMTDDEFQSTDPYDTTSEWIDMEPSPYIDTVTANSEQEACEKAGRENRYDARCLYAIPIDIEELLHVKK